MLDVDTFLTTLYVTVDDFCQSHTPKRKPGPHASLCASEVITLSLFARWSRFSSERDFYRYAQTNLTDAFPSLPERSQFNRLVRSHTELMEAFFLHLVALLEVRKRPYEALDSSAMPTRDCKRTGHGWLAGQADIGWSNSLGDGTKAFLCSPLQIPLESSRVCALEPPLPPTNRWPRLSLL
jgi:hypothetical protein